MRASNSVKPGSNCGLTHRGMGTLIRGDMKWNVELQENQRPKIRPVSSREVYCYVGAQLLSTPGLFGIFEDALGHYWDACNVA